MIINHNMSAINANRQMATNQSATAKSTEKLSSGLRINRAGDDAAGLAISEKMRAQVAGLNKASDNAQDGISLLQTAEGALNETHSILQRIRELTTQSSNDTNVEADRDAINEEITQLTKEIDRIAETTQFNSKNLLDGKLSGKLQIGANAGQILDISIDAMDSKSLGLSSTVTIEADITASGATKLKDGTYTIDGANVLDKDKNIVGKFAAGVIELPDTKTLTFAEKGGTTLANGITSITINGDRASVDVKTTAATELNKLAPGKYTVSSDASKVYLEDKEIGTLTTTTLKLEDGTSIDLTQVGLTAKDVEGGDSFTVKGVDVKSADKASASLKTLDNAIETVSKQRSSLGALQNRLEHTISNLDNASENTQAAESRIRDVNMAEEMMEFTKNNVLSQASQAMLAQAKALPNQVLSLLQ